MEARAMTADVELLPCPCGAAAAIHNTGVSAGPKEKMVVACVDPECHWSMTGYGAKQAATRWNRRATAAQAAEIARLNEAFDARERMLTEIEQAHAVEIEALRAEVRERDASLAWWGRFASGAVNSRKEAEARAERLAEALRLYEKAGIGNSTDFRLQAEARDAANRALLRDQEEGK